MPWIDWIFCPKILWQLSCAFPSTIHHVQSNICFDKLSLMYLLCFLLVIRTASLGSVLTARSEKKVSRSSSNSAWTFWKPMSLFLKSITSRWALATKAKAKNLTWNCFFLMFASSLQRTWLTKGFLIKEASCPTSGYGQIFPIPWWSRFYGPSIIALLRPKPKLYTCRTWGKRRALEIQSASSDGHCRFRLLVNIQNRNVYT